MRIGIVADTHGFLDPRIADQLAECDLAVHAGDIGGAEVLCAMQPREEVYAVRGNVDDPETWPAHEEHMLENLPERLTLDLPGGQLAVLHGESVAAVARNERLRSEIPEVRAIVCGHTHELSIDDSVLPWVLNPGAAGRVRVGTGPSMLILECAETAWEVTPLHFPPRRYRAISGGNNEA
ncbi:YfcE family phosphodiesterase [Halorhodospira abdelmalekii]|uniref:metallophosphoesterase family protein n=1 Tax=Halorhodospira abdelmalekii TaxID=421629 RepID=UPI00190512F7|nr:metallophosphoesterase family protein [Halorhodospira abdelmalekii]MBK1733932.1 YfcE family phosphodiesterase [Halorhodospira abdelmalekii]